MKGQILILLLLLGLVCPLAAQEKVEQVKVDWWVLPLFAVDDKDNPVHDLLDDHIEIYMDNRKVDNFLLMRKDFSVKERSRKKTKTGPKKLLFEKGKIVFLIFDRVMTGGKSLRRAKATARELINKTESSMEFALFTIEPGAGLKYLAGPLKDKDKLHKIIKGIKEKDNRRYFRSSEIYTQMVGGGKGGGVAKYSARNIKSFERTSGKLFKMNSIPFFESFETFYFNVNSIKKNKFIYLFTEGISGYQTQKEKGDTYTQFLSQIASYLGRCGGVLFIVNPAMAEAGLSSGGFRNFNYTTSGKDSLKFLANKSGGKYIHSHKKGAIEKINNFHRSYYEVAFADPGDLKGNVHDIVVKSRRKGILLHTLNTIEKERAYKDLTPVEQELLAINLVSQNPLYETPIRSWAVPVIKRKKNRDKISITVKVPDRFLGRKIDLYRVLADNNNVLPSVEKESLLIKKKRFSIDFMGVKEKDINFVLLDPLSNSALVEGPALYDELPGLVKRKKALSDNPQYLDKLETILDGAANYCERLRKDAFHYFCNEKIIETHTPLKQEKRKYLSDGERRLIETFSNLTSARGVDPKMPQKIDSYYFDYQLISDKGKIKEQRKLLSQTKSPLSVENMAALISAFLTEKATFGPITLLARDRQHLFQFRLLKYEKLQDRRCAVIETIPRKRRDNHFSYGMVWVDAEDHSVRRIEIDPKSIAGYKNLQLLAKQLKAKLFLDCVVEYDKKHGKLWFPTLISISETYKGSPILREKFKLNKWERYRTTIAYQDYRFFNVDTAVLAEQ